MFRKREKSENILVSQLKQKLKKGSRVIKWKTQTQRNVYVSAETNGDIKVWEMDLCENFILRGFFSVDTHVVCVCQIDALTLCVGLQNGELQWWRLPFGDEISIEPVFRRVHVTGSPVYSVCCSENGVWHASAGAREIRIWYKEDEAPKLMYRLRTSEIPRHVNFVPDTAPDEKTMTMEKCRPPI